MSIGAVPPPVPGYRLDRLIGEGGFGQVWLGTREDGAEVVAIKVLHLELVRSNDALIRFGREFAAIERLRHPHVVRAIAHGILDDGRPFIVMEHVPGPSLREVLHERGALPPADVLAVLEPLCDALTTAHAAGLVHRDVKASNVILADGATARPVLLDFGLVKLIDEQGPGLTSSRSMLGTPAAMAPEQIRGQAVDSRTDIYALGLLTFHLLTGTPAYGGAPGVVQSYLQIHGARPRPSSKVDLDPAIDEPVLRALEPDPSARFPTARAFYEALRAVIQRGEATDVEVVALYAEADPATVTRVSAIATAAGMTVALSAPDSMLAVAPWSRVGGTLDLAAMRLALAAIASAKLALGVTQATLQGAVVDGTALDVEAWAPYPLPVGLWIGPGLADPTEE